MTGAGLTGTVGGDVGTVGGDAGADGVDSGAAGGADTSSAREVSALSALPDTCDLRGRSACAVMEISFAEAAFLAASCCCDCGGTTAAFLGSSSF